MEEIDLKELFDFVKNKIGLLIIITVGICLLGCVYGLILQKPMYRSYTTVILSGTEQTITQSDVTLNKNLVDTYAEIVKSRRVLDQVINELDLDSSLMLSGKFAGVCYDQEGYNHLKMLIFHQSKSYLKALFLFLYSIDGCFDDELRNIF